MQTGSSVTLIGWKSGQTTFIPLWDRMEGAWLWTQVWVRRATRRLISSRYVSKGLFTDVTAWAKACLGCHRAKVHGHVQVPPQHILVPTHRFSHIHMHLLGSLPASKGFTYLFTIIDRTSHWPEAIPIAATSTVDCANALFQGWVSRFGVLAVITSDRGSGTQFTSSLWAALSSLLNIQHS
jgi:hypothetical protein